MQSGLYVALSSQIALDRRMTTIADNLANMNTVGFRATQLKFDDVMKNADGARVAYVSEGDEYVSTRNGGLTQTKNPLDFATKGDTWFSIETPLGAAITRDGRFSILDTGALVTLEGNPVLDAGGGPIILDPNAGPPELSQDGTLYQNGRPVASLGLFRLVDLPGDQAAGLIVAVLGGDFSRKGYSKRIAVASAAAITVLIVQLAAQSAAADNPALNILQWLLPIGVTSGLSYTYFTRGRSLGKIERPAFELFRTAGGARS